MTEPRRPSTGSTHPSGGGARPGGIARRDFLRLAGSCAAHLALLGAAPHPAAARGLFLRSRGRHIVQEEPWGRLEEVAEGVWALVSTPLEDRTTLCNGGIVAGRAGVAVIEAFATPEGAGWMAGRARALTGRWPDHVLLTHYHGDHTAGCAAFAEEGGGAAVLRATGSTRDATDRTAAARGAGPDAPLRRALASVTLLPETGAVLDLGGRILRCEALAGHTESDVAVLLEDPAVAFCGDLVWNGMFPNYVDAVPSRLSAAVARIASLPAGTTFVPGHGPLADAADLGRYVALLDGIEAAARAAHAAGRTAAEAAGDFALPDDLAAWALFSPAYPERALDAWLRELRGDPRAGATPAPRERPS